MSYRNTGGSLGQQEILREHKPTGKSFYSFSPTLPQVFLYLKRKTENMFSILLEKYVMKTIQENNLFIMIIKMQVIYACAMKISTAHASSVFILIFSINILCLAFCHN